DSCAVGGEGYGTAAGRYEMYAEAGVEVDIVAGAEAEGLGRAAPRREDEDAVGRVVIDGVAVQRGVQVDDGAAGRGGDGIHAGVIEGDIVVGDAERDEIDRAGAGGAVVEAEAGATIAGRDVADDGAGLGDQPVFDQVLELDGVSADVRHAVA